MANHGPSFGLDAELEAKRLSQYDPALEREASDWISSMTGAGVGSFHESLKSGVILCKLANKLKPGSVGKIATASAPFVQMENINAFLNFCKSYGVPAPDLFMTVDLYENKNLNQVIQTILSLKRRSGGGLVSSKPAQVPLNTSEPAPKPAPTRSTAPAPSSASRAPAATSSSSRPPAPAATSSPSPAPAPSGGVNFCSNCGTKASGGKFCSSCGNKL